VEVSRLPRDVGGIDLIAALQADSGRPDCPEFRAWALLWPGCGSTLESGRFGVTLNRSAFSGLRRKLGGEVLVSLVDRKASRGSLGRLPTRVTRSMTQAVRGAWSALTVTSVPAPHSSVELREHSSVPELHGLFGAASVVRQDFHEQSVAAVRVGAWIRQASSWLRSQVPAGGCAGDSDRGGRDGAAASPPENGEATSTYHTHTSGFCRGSKDWFQPCCISLMKILTKWSCASADAGVLRECSRARCFRYRLRRWPGLVLAAIAASLLYRVSHPAPMVSLWQARAPQFVQSVVPLIQALQRPQVAAFSEQVLDVANRTRRWRIPSRSMTKCGRPPARKKVAAMRQPDFGQGEGQETSRRSSSRFGSDNPNADRRSGRPSAGRWRQQGKPLERVGSTG
jgi:hypothetical protein